MHHGPVATTRQTLKVVRIGHKKGPLGGAGGPCIGADSPAGRTGVVRLGAADQNTKIRPTA
jgi:hypothetical protein